MSNDRQREVRSETVARERRRRDDTSANHAQRMAIPPEVEARLKAEGRTPRWVNDEGNRMHRMTVQDDYDKVDGVDPVPVGTDKSGAPIMAHLLSKPNDFIAEDRAKAEQQRKETERGMLKGRVPTAPGQESVPVQGAHGAEMYVASETKIGRGNQIIE
jgi:hypothetical protein